MFEFMLKNVEKMSINYSPNFYPKKRSISKVKYLIFHYTGMKSEIGAIKKLTDKNSKVSCHYFIKKNGEIINMVPDLYIAWHAGISYWKKDKFLNSKSIGVEISNPGHEYGYKEFNKKQIKSIIILSKKLKKKYKIKNNNILGHSDIAPLRKKDPGEKFPWKKLSFHKIGTCLKKNKTKVKLNLKNREKLFFKNLKILGYRYFSIYKRNSKDKKIIRSFQQHYLPDNVNGKIDQKTFETSYFLAH